VRITIKKIQGVLLSNLMVLALAACSSSPSPWSQQDDSPWKAKRSAEESSVANEEFEEVPLDEPVYAEPEPMIEEAPMVAEPEPMVEPVAVVAAGGVLSLPPTHYAVQVYAGATVESVNRYQEAHGLQDLTMVETDRDGSSIYVLVSIHDDRASANQAAADLEQKTGSKPWVRSMAGLQKVAVE